MKIKLFQDIYNVFYLIFLLLNAKRFKSHHYNKVHFITFRRFSPNGGAGGGGAVLSANKIIFEENLGNIPIKYSFYEENKFSKTRKNDLWDLYGAVLFVKQKVKSSNDYVYITHDYGTAFGLALMGKKYILVSHIQGSRVEEKINFGEKFTTISRLIIQFCEKYSFKHAYKVCFPSNGAYEYFCNSPWKIIRREEFTKGNTLYNTLYAFPKSEQYLGVEKANDTLTFLSVGQLTIAKGMDKHPLLFEKILEKTNKKIRYIMVGKGKLEKEILKNLEGLKIKYDNFDYMYIEKCSYPQMQYLQDISDVYLMLHRISIFDLTTLEVMKKGKCIILSDVGGNPEFNKENNIILCDNYEQCANDFINCNLDKLSIKNKEVYNQYFSQEQFKINYLIIMKDLLNSEMQYNVE